MGPHWGESLGKVTARAGFADSEWAGGVSGWACGSDVLTLTVRMRRSSSRAGQLLWCHHCLQQWKP